MASDEQEQLPATLNGPLQQFKAPNPLLWLHLRFLHAAVLTRIFRHCAILPTRPYGHKADIASPKP